MRQEARLTGCFLGAALAALTGLVPGPARAEEEAMACPAIPYWPVTKRARFPALVTELFPPLKVIQEIGRDPLENAPKRQASVVVVDAAGKKVRGALVAFLRRDGRDLRFLAEARAGAAVPLGDYVVNAALAEPGGGVRWGTATLSVRAKGAAAATVKLLNTIAPVRPLPLAGETFQGAEVALDVEGFWQANATLETVWTGPESRHTEIDEEPPDMPPTLTRRPFALALPGRVGPYEIRYTLCAPRLVLARWPLRVARAQVSIEAPERAPAASPLAVTLRGNLAKAQTLRLRDAEGKLVQTRALAAEREQHITLWLPFEPGRYELVVATPGERAPLARRALRVEPVALAIDYPERVELGTTATLSWPLVDSIDTRLALWSAPARGQPAREVWPRLAAGKLRLVAAPGDYELRLYYRKALDEPRIVARKAVTVAGRAFAAPPAEVAAGQPVTLKLALAGGFFDRAMFVPRGRDKPASLFDEIKPERDTVTLKAPAAPGAYDLLYQLGEVGQRMIVERVPVEVR